MKKHIEKSLSLFKIQNYIILHQILDFDKDGEFIIY